ncbi:MAG: PP2C family protein-serine/threonine phosphatase, partial [Phycisphaerae bacterium]
AGHQLPVIVTAGGAAPAESAGGGFPLGVVEDATFTTTTIPGVGDAPFVFFAYTDGVTEAANADRELFGTDRLMALLDASRDLGPGALVTKVRKAVAGFAGGAAQSDDITMLAARVG